MSDEPRRNEAKPGCDCDAPDTYYGPHREWCNVDGKGFDPLERERDEQFVSAARSFASGVIGGPDVPGHVRRLAKMFADFYREGWEDAGERRRPDAQDGAPLGMRCAECGQRITTYVEQFRCACGESYTGPERHCRAAARKGA